MKTWITPTALQEDFIANSAVSSCIKGTLECSYPGGASTKGDYIFGDYHGYENEYWFEDKAKKMPHGRCAYPTPVSINTDSWSGYERDANGNILKDHPIQNVSIGDVKVGMHDRVSWESIDGNTNTVYHHLGRLNVSLIDNDHPARS